MGADPSCIAQFIPGINLSKRMYAKLTLLGSLLLSFGSFCVGHDKDQMPLDYVRYPYQATYYPGDNSG